MLKSNLKARVKSSKFIYTLYYLLGSFFLRVMSVFIKRDPNLLLFVSYGGKKYDDSPRKVYEYLLSRKEYSDLEMVWAFDAPENYPEVNSKIRIDSLRFFKTALKAGYWITNSSISRGLNYRKRTTKNIFFTHGMTGIKRIGNDLNSKEGTYSLAFKERFDYIFIEGYEEVPILTQAWGYAPDVFKRTGLPRNDDLYQVSEQEIIAIKEKLLLPAGKKIILYAPTFREQSRDEFKANVLSFPFHIEKWEQELGEEYVLLITAHYEVSRYLDEIHETDFVRNMFGYPVLNDLLKVADILITDYSSVVFDYSLLERPILCYGYDYEEYNSQRGFYIDIRNLFSQGVIEEEETLINTIKRLDYQEECLFTKKNIKDKYVYCDGHAAENAVKIIFEDAEK